MAGQHATGEMVVSDLTDHFELAVTSAAKQMFDPAVLALLPLLLSAPLVLARLALE
jgi:hypothetical protein